MASAIVKAAIEIATNEGWPNVTMRKIADKIEYSHAALYEYFPGRSAILLEVYAKATENCVRRPMLHCPSTAEA